MNDSEKAHQKELVRQLCTKSNWVFRLELCVARHLEGNGHSKEIVKSALSETRLGNLEPLAQLLSQ